jgi:hypothetical protein
MISKSPVLLLELSVQHYNQHRELKSVLGVKIEHLVEREQIGIAAYRDKGIEREGTDWYSNLQR